VDRIVVAPDHRGRGLGALLYSAVFDAARALGAEDVVCEVNLKPANPESLAFHDRLGFTEVGQQSTKNDTVVVSLLSAAVAEVRSAPPE
jgi:predicted GNAT superfamily acetyltransferase